MAKKQPCSFCGNLIPDSGVFGLPTYTDVPENHKEDCPVREVMEVRLAQEDSEAQMGTWEQDAKVFLALEEVADAAQVCITAWGQEYIPSGDFEPEVEHLERYMDICWAALKPMSALKVKLKALKKARGGDR